VTPEERFIKIENSLNTVSGHLADIAVRHDLMKAQHDADVREVRLIQKGMGRAIATVAKAQAQTNKALARLAEAHERTESKLSALIDTVDRFIRNSGGGGEMPQAT
jgi:hypothetical protein